MIFFPLGIQSLFAMAQGSKRNQLFALLEIVLIAPMLISSILFATCTFPFFETLQTFGMEIENAQIFANNTQFSTFILYKEIFYPITSVIENLEVPAHYPTMSIWFLVVDVLMIWWASILKELCEYRERRKREIGPFLLGLNVISLAVSHFTLFI